MRKLSPLFLLVVHFTFAQDISYPYLYVDHWAYTYLELLQNRGQLTELSHLVRPFKRMDVALSLKKLDSEKLTSAEKQWRIWLEQEFQDELKSLDGGSVDSRLEARLNAQFSETGRNSSWQTNYFINPEVNVLTSHLAVATRGTIDRSFQRDPSYTGYKTSLVGARVTDGYGLFQFSRLEFFVGRFAENWSPILHKSLILSDNTLTYDKLGFQFTTKRLSFRSFFAKLDNYQQATRYFSAHRFDLLFNNGIQFGFSETVVHGSPQGRKMPINLSYLNPFEIYADVQHNDKQEANEMISIDAFIPYRQWNFRGQFLIDDFILDGADKPPPNRKTSPDRLGFLFALQHHNFLVDNSQWTLTYERIGSYTYNLKSNRPWQSYTFQNRGIGNLANDRDSWTLAIGYFAISKILIDANMTYDRQGQRTLFSHDYDETNPIVVGKFPRGIVEKQVAVKLNTFYRHSRIVSGGVEIGSDFISNHKHVKGSNKTLFNARIQINYLLDHSFSLED